MWSTPLEYRPLSLAQARRLVRAYGVRLPRVGYEICLVVWNGREVWLTSTGHSDFGWFGRTATTPYELNGPIEAINAMMQRGETMASPVVTVRFAEIRSGFAACGGSPHFFSAETTRWFGSRYPRQGFVGPGGCYYVTSEQPPTGPRVWTVRQWRGRAMETMGTHGAYTSRRAAQAVAQAEARW